MCAEPGVVSIDVRAEPVEPVTSWPFHAPVIHRTGIVGMPGPVHVHGAGIVDGQFVHEQAPPAPRPFSEHLGMSIRGALTLYLGREAILPDPLGASMTFIWDRDGEWAISSDQRALVAWLRSRGLDVRTSELYGWMLAGAGMGSFNLSSYDGISALPAHHYVTVTGESYSVHPYPFQAYLDEEIAYPDALDEAEAEILGNVKAVAKAGFSRITVHLTGGLDSRLVTAACLKAGFDFVSFCSGPIQSPDKATAHAICADLELPMTHRPGFTETEMLPSMADRLRDEMESVAGMTLVTRLGTKAAGDPGTVVLSGGMGERFRGRYGLRGDEPIREIANSVWGDTLFPEEGAAGILAPAATQRILSLLTSAIQTCGSDLAIRMEVFRTRFINQYVFGLTTRRFSEVVPRFDPLYSLAAIRASLVGGVEVREQRRIAYALMSRFEPRLVSLPFGDSAWPAALDPPAPRTPRGGQPRYIDRQAEVLPLWAGMPKATPVQLEQIRRVRASAWQIVHLAETQRLCREIFARSPWIARGFDRVMANRLINHEPAHRQQIRHLYQMAIVALWLESSP